jgi:hypothetical protein
MNLALRLERVDQFLVRRDDLYVAERHADVHRRRVQSERRLRPIHVIVRVEGHSPFFLPLSSRPRLAMTSFAFMFVEVPAPPWKSA